MPEEIEFSFPDREPAPVHDGVLNAPGRTLLVWLKRCVADNGGVLVNAVCRPETIKYPTIKGADLTVNSCSCGEDALALVPYKTIGGENSEAKVCLVCDGAVAWPNLDPGPVPNDDEPFHW